MRYHNLSYLNTIIISVYAYHVKLSTNIFNSVHLIKIKVLNLSTLLREKTQIESYEKLFTYSSTVKESFYTELYISILSAAY